MSKALFSKKNREIPLLLELRHPILPQQQSKNATIRPGIILYV
jgi:hypothetical protein